MPGSTVAYWFHLRSVLFFPDGAEAEVAVSPMLPRKERLLVDSNLNEEPKSKTSLNPLISLIKKKKKTAPTPPTRSSSFKHSRDDFNNGCSLSDATLGFDPSKFLCLNNNGSSGVTNGVPAYPGQVFPPHPRKKGTTGASGSGRLATTPPGEEDLSSSKRFHRSSSASSMPPGSDRNEWKSVTLPRDVQSRHFDSSTLGSKPALPRKSTPRGGTLTPPPRLSKKTEDALDEVFKDSESSPGSSPQTLTPKLGHRSQLQSDGSKTSAFQADLLKSNAFFALGAAGEECRARRHKQPLDISSQREKDRGKFSKSKPAPPPPPPSSVKSGKVSRSPTQDLTTDIKVKVSLDLSPSGSEQSRSFLPQESTKKLSTSKAPPSKTTPTSPTGQPLGVPPSSPAGDPGSATAFIPLVTTRRSLRKTRQNERIPNSTITREMVLESTELLRAAISRNSEQTGSHNAVLEAGNNLSKYCLSYVDSIQQMRNKFAFREAINKLESSLRELQICPTATGGASTPQDFTKLLSSLKEISDIVQR